MVENIQVENVVREKKRAQENIPPRRGQRRVPVQRGAVSPPHTWHSVPVDGKVKVNVVPDRFLLS